YGSARREDVEVEELLVGREEGLVIVEADPASHLQARVRVAEAENDRVEERVEHQAGEQEDCRRNEEHRLPAFAPEDRGQPPSPGSADWSGDGGATHPRLV